MIQLKFKVGDAVTLKNPFYSGSRCQGHPGGTIIEIDDTGTDPYAYRVKATDGCDVWTYEANLEKIDVINSTNCMKQLKDLKQGDLVYCHDGCIKKVLGICGEVYFLSNDDDFASFDNGWTSDEMECVDMSANPPTDDEDFETIDIEGEEYTLSEVKEALKKNRG